MAELDFSDPYMTRELPMLLQGEKKPQAIEFIYNMGTE